MFRVTWFNNIEKKAMQNWLKWRRTILCFYCLFLPLSSFKVPCCNVKKYVHILGEKDYFQLHKIFVFLHICSNSMHKWEISSFFKLHYNFIRMSIVFKLLKQYVYKCLSNSMKCLPKIVLMKFRVTNWEIKQCKYLLYKCIIQFDLYVLICITAE